MDLHIRSYISIENAWTKQCETSGVTSVHIQQVDGAASFLIFCKSMHVCLSLSNYALQWLFGCFPTATEWKTYKLQDGHTATRTLPVFLFLSHASVIKWFIKLTHISSNRQTWTHTHTHTYVTRDFMQSPTGTTLFPTDYVPMQQNCKYD